MAHTLSPKDVQRRVRDARAVYAPHGREVHGREVHAHYGPEGARGEVAGPLAFAAPLHGRLHGGVVFGEVRVVREPRGHEPPWSRNAFEAYERTTARALGAPAFTYGPAHALPPAAAGGPAGAAAGEALYGALSELLGQFVTDATASFLLRRQAVLEAQFRQFAEAHLAALPQPPVWPILPGAALGTMAPAPGRAPAEHIAHPAAHTDARPAGPTVAALLAGVQALTPRIAAAFADAFGARPAVTLAARLGEDRGDGREAEPHLELILDAEGADPDVVDAARERGARADFVGALTELLSADVLDRLRVVYRFPRR